MGKQQQHRQHAQAENTYYYPTNVKKMTLPKKPKPKKIKSIKTKKKIIDKHNKRDKAGNYPKHDVDGNLYPFLCDICSKGFAQKAALNGHQSVHKRMEKMG